LGRLRVLSGAQVVQILEEHGFRQIRQRGSHVALQIRVELGVRTVVVPLHRELRPGTLASIIRQSGLSRDRFETD
jgi:predicted RNA binding protein YcfA (HicA-like mRNA interferase family)